MFGALVNLSKAVVGAVVEVPISVAADAITLGGSLTDKKQPYTATAVEKIVKNVQEATK